MSNSETSKLEAWLRGLDEEVASSKLNVFETINLDTIHHLGGGSTDPPPSMSGLPVLDLGDDDGELQVVRKLGSGGMGQVHLARQRALERDVAVKRLPRRSDNPLAAYALLQEARVTGRLEHPNIVPVHMLGCDGDGHPAIVMKRVEGVPWRDLITGDATAMHETKVWSDDTRLLHIEILLEICNAVQFAHSMGIVHRDIKPSNVMVGMFGEVYLLDWGIAVPVGTAALSHNGDSSAPLPLGTPAFMAPELISFEGVVEERTDVYLLGACLHMALTGQARHQGDDLLDVFMSASASKPVDYADDVPAELATICNKAMSKKPADRHPDVQSFRQELNDYISHRGSLRLGAEADIRLAKLEELFRRQDAATQDLSGLRKLFTECRFAYKQALSEWQDNDQAQRGLQGCLEAMARFELSRGNDDAAQLLVDELDDTPQQLLHAVASARDAARAERDRLQALQELSEDLDIGVSTRSRFIWSIVLAVAVVFIGAIFLPVGREALVKRSNWTILLAFSIFGIAFMLTLYRGREQLLRNTANIRVAATIGIGLAAMMGQRTIAALEGIDMRVAGANDLMLCAVVSALASATVDRGMALIAAIYAAGAALIIVLPGGRSTTLAFIGAQAVAFTIAGIYWLVRRDEGMYSEHLDDSPPATGPAPPSSAADNTDIES